MRSVLKHTITGRFAIIFMTMLMLVLSPVSASHAMMHDHGDADTIVEHTLAAEGFDHSHGQYDHRNINDDDGSQAPSMSHDNSETCCSAVCASAIIISEFFSDKPTFAKPKFDWLTAPLIAGETDGLYRPPNA